MAEVWIRKELWSKGKTEREHTTKRKQRSGGRTKSGFQPFCASWLPGGVFLGQYFSPMYSYSCNDALGIFTIIHMMSFLSCLVQWYFLKLRVFFVLLARPIIVLVWQRGQNLVLCHLLCHLHTCSPKSWNQDAKGPGVQYKIIINK